MDAKKLAKTAQSNNLAVFVSGLPKSGHGTGHEPGGHGAGGDGALETLREDEYDSHKIVIRTTYRIEVDGKILQVPLGLDHEGKLHCHSLPNYEFKSAIDMVKLLIDNFPDDFKSKKSSPKKSAGHGGHGVQRKRAKKGGK